MTMPGGTASPRDDSDGHVLIPAGIIAGVSLIYRPGLRNETRSEDTRMGYVRSLRCRECGAEYPPTRLTVCEACFGPREGAYETEAVREAFTREALARRPETLWRYRELLPVFDEGAIVDLEPGYTPPPP